MKFEEYKDDLEALSESDTPESPSSKHAMSIIFDSFEQALKVVGSFGRYHIGFILIYQVTVLIWCGNYVFMAYGTYAPEVRCITNDQNFTVNVLMNHSNPERFCQIYEAGNCSMLEWDAPFKTIIEEWKLICNLDYVPQMINSIQVSGTFVALFFSGPLSDMLGRKLVFCATFVMLMLATFCSMLSTNWVFFAIFRFFVGGLLSSGTSISCVWGMELTDQKHNVIMNLAGSWQFGYIITALIAYLSYQWTTYLLVLNLIGLPLIFIYPFCIESPRWQVQTGQLDKAAISLSRLGSQTNMVREVSRENLAGIPCETHSEARMGYMSLFSSSRLTQYTLVLSLGVFATAAAANAYIFQVTQLSGSPFIKFALYGSLRIVIPIVIYLADRYLEWFGRRHMMLIHMGIVCLCYSAATVIKYFPGELSESAEFYVMLAGAVACNGLWVALAQFLVELYPTVMRNTAFSFTAFFDPIAGVLMPQLVYLQKYWPVLLVFVAALLSFFSFISAYIILPETKGMDIPETVDAVQHPKSLVNGGVKWTRVKTCCDAEDESLLVNDMELNEETGAN